MVKKPYILWFDELGLKDLPIVGGKNASLGEMRKELTKQGVNVPNGFAVTVNAYHDYIDACIFQECHEAKSKLEVRESIREIISDFDAENVEVLSERVSRIR